MVGGAARLLGLALVALCPLAAPDFVTGNVGSPSIDFSRHVVIKPKIFHGREKRQISTTLEDEGLHTHDLTLGYDVDGKEYTLDLRLNRELIPANFFIRYQHQGKHVINNTTEKDINLCQYVGNIRGVKDSWAAISTCRGLRGVIYDGETMHYVQPGENSLDAPHFLYKHEDLISNHTCGYVGGHHNASSDALHNSEEHEFNRILRYKRSAPQNEPLLRGPYNANKKSRYVELVLVVDNKEFKELEENLGNVHHHCKDIANIINSLYAPLNIFIALVGIVVWTEYDEIKLSDNGDTTLTNFLHYRRERLVRDHPNDNAQLLTREQFAGGVVGKALKGPICTYEFSGGVAMDHSSVVGLVATTIAHEMGHNFGMEHDTEKCKCPDERCIMSPSSNALSPTHWSSCSLEYLALAFEHGMDYCLRNKPKKLFESPVCGNGFVELGEECDCGLSKTCDGNYCCNPATCMLYPNATCATGECCDLNTCRPMNAGTICRSAEHECDLPEFCTGQSEFCPDDVFKMDTEKCEGGNAFCYQGSCRTRSDQCRLLWGPSGESSDEKCYEMNRKGSRHGNCGYNRLKQNFSKCQDENLLCGMLHCRHLNERLEFGMESVAILSHSFINNRGAIIPCRTAIVDLGLNQIDPGLVPDGAKCGDGKMCVNQKCLSVDALRLEIQAKSDSNAVCPSDCSGHGVCNSLGHCHCNNGFAPPLCEYPGQGGSIDSGPASPDTPREFVMLICLLLAGVLATVFLIAILRHYAKYNVIGCWKGPKSISSKSPSKNGIQRHVSRGASCLGLCSPSNSIPTTVSPTTPHLSPDDMNSSLLPVQNSQSSEHHNFFGHFKGFTLTPLQKQEKTFGVSNDNFGIENEQNPQSVSSFNPKSSKSNSVRNTVNAINSKNTNQPEAKNETSTNTVIITSSPTQRVPQRSAPAIPTVPSVTVKIPGRPNLLNANINKPTATISRTGSVASNTLDKNKSIVAAGVETSNSASMAPALPPANPGANSARPIISNPILETSTCTAKELVSPLKHSGGSVVITAVPLRAAPSAPVSSESNKRPLSSPNSVTNSINTLEQPLPKKPKDGNTLNRIASFLKQDKSEKDKSRNAVERSHSLPKNQNNQIKAFKNIDKNELRALPISNPIPLNEIELPGSSSPVVSDFEDVDGKFGISRAQSMRGPASPTKQKLPTFGSMRQPSNVKRPTSIHITNRPTSPPPPRPDNTVNPNKNDQKLPSIPGYQNSNPHKFSSLNKLANTTKTPEYDDCVAENHTGLTNISEENSPDNIYAIIEESPPPDSINKIFSKPLPGIPSKINNIKNSQKQAVDKSNTSDNSGLLGEIVSEIQNRNLESIYSASTLNRKKKEKEAGLNTSDMDTDENEYTNLGPPRPVSGAPSTTSSGYLAPSAVNVPVHMPNSKISSASKINEEVTFHLKPDDKKSEKSNDKIEPISKPYVSTFNRASGPFAASYNKNKIEDTPNQKNQNANQSEVQAASNLSATKIDRKITPPKSSVQSIVKNISNQPNVPTNPKNSLSSVRNSFKSSLNKTQTNSPDLISSCANNTQNSVKSPDVVNNQNSSNVQSSISKPTGFDQGVILKPSLQSSIPPKPSSMSGFQKTPSSSMSKSFTKKEPQKTFVNGMDLNKPVLRSAPSPPANSNVNDKKKITPPRPTLPKVLQNNVNQKNPSSGSSLSSSKSNSIENNLSSATKTNISVPEKPKHLAKNSSIRKSDDISNKVSNNMVKPSVNSKISNVANLQQKFETPKSTKVVSVPNKKA